MNRHIFKLKSPNLLVLYFLCCFSFISIKNLPAQNEVKQPLDSYNHLDQPIDSVMTWLNGIFKNDTSDGFHRIALHTLQRAYKKKDTRAIADLHLRISEWSSYQGYFHKDTAVYHSEKAVHFYTQLKDTTRIAEAYLSLSLHYSNAQRVEDGQVTLLKAIKLLKASNNEAGMAEAHRYLAMLYRDMNDMESSIKYSNLAIDFFEREKDYKSVSKSLFNNILGYKHLEKYDSALVAADKCIAIIEAHIPDAPGISFRAYSFRADVLMDTKNYTKALDDYKISWDIAAKGFGSDRTEFLRVEIGKALHFLGKNEEAIVHLEAGLQEIIATQSKEEQMSEPYLTIANCYKALGNYEKALLNREKAADIDVMILEKKIEVINSETLIKYETDKKDQSIILQRAQLKQKSIIQTIILGVTIGLALLLSALFYFFRKNQKTKLALEKKNTENELLLKEIHHRVKNNLQTISSLLSLQSNTIEDTKALNAVNESKNRVASMALIHQKLYQGENLAAIEMRDYFETIGTAILNSFGEKAKKVTLKVDMPNLELDVDTAVPIGLITNELITNSLKYAFQEQENGLISIALVPIKNNTFQLKIKDNGINKSQEKSPSTNHGFGSLLIQLLTTQLGGNLKANTNEGTSTIIEFSVQEKIAA